MRAAPEIDRSALRCPRCYATADERCRTEDGRPTSHHVGHPKVARCESWGCGAKLGEPCRTEKGNPTKKPHAGTAEAQGRSGAAQWAWSQAFKARTDETHARFRAADERYRGLLGARPAEGLAALGLTATATKEEVARAFRRRALETHPDHGGDPEAFKALVHARDGALAAIGGGR